MFYKLCQHFFQWSDCSYPVRKSAAPWIRFDFFEFFWVEWFSLWSLGSLGHDLRKAHEKKSKGRAGAKYASTTPSSNLFLFRSLLFNPQHPSLDSHYPTPSCPPPPSSLQPATDTFCIWRVQPREQSSLSFPKISWWERERDHQLNQGVRSSTAPGYKTREWELSLPGPRAFRSIYTAYLSDWLTGSYFTVIHALSLPLCPTPFAPSLLLSTLVSKSAQIGKVFLRPASGQPEDSTERIYHTSPPSSFPK